MKMYTQPGASCGVCRYTHKTHLPCSICQSGRMSWCVGISCEGHECRIRWRMSLHRNCRRLLKPFLLVLRQTPGTPPQGTHRGHIRAWALTLFLVVISTVCLTGRAEAAVYNLHLVTDNGPDYTDIQSFVQSATERWSTPQEKCIAIWRWGRRSRRQTSCADDDGRLIWDPILHYNSYGTMNCGVISALNISSFLQLGYQARYVQLGDHTVSEVSWDGGQSWHLFDSSMSFYLLQPCRGSCQLPGNQGIARVRTFGRKERARSLLLVPRCSTVRLAHRSRRMA